MIDHRTVEQPSPGSAAEPAVTDGQGRGADIRSLHIELGNLPNRHRADGLGVRRFQEE